jgi:hypothetical protein
MLVGRVFNIRPGAKLDIEPDVTILRENDL